VVGTPGRVIDLYGQKFLSFPWTEFVALDEADQMLEIGFIDDVRKILSYTPDERQTMLFSATFPDEVLRLAREATRDPMEVATAAGHATVKTIDQSWMACGRSDRSLALMRLIEQSSADDVFLVFCDRRTEVDALMRQLERMPFSVKALHGGFDQASRFRVMSAFRTGEVKALVATDVASRGLDVHLVTHVVNYSVPQDAQDYTHRIGRTGRAGREGVAITFLEPREHRLLKNIQHATGQKITVATIPTVADLRNRRLEMTGLALREALVAGELESFRVLVENLASEFDPLDVAAAATKLAHEANHSEVAASGDEQDIPQPQLRPDRPERRPRDARPQWGREEGRERGRPWEERGPRAPRQERPFEERGPAPERGPAEGRPYRDERPPFEGRPREFGGRPPRFERGPRQDFGDTLRIFIGAGRFDGLRPGDLVGAIANEAGLAGNEIGPIQIADRFSLVEVPAPAAHHVIGALRGTTIRGRRVNVRLDRAD
jgi:ATP-dependent RNA helicase DeaD